MNLKINYDYFYILIFASFFFFWGINLSEIKFLSFLIPDYLYNNYSVNLKLSYLIVFLIIPIIYKSIISKSLSFKKIFNYQQYIIYFTLFVIIHFLFVKVYYDEIISKSEITNIFYLLLLAIIYCHYRNFIFVNFKKIIIFYLVIFVIYSIYEGSRIYNEGFLDGDGVLQFKNLGQCNVDIFLIDILKKYLNISLSNSIYLENSHLGLMTIAVFFSSIFILIQEKKKNILLLLLLLIEVIIVLNNLSTTFFVGFFFTQITLLLFFYKKINNKYWIITLLFFCVNSYFFLSDKNCTTKITDFQVQSVVKNKLVKGPKNLTTLIYERSMIVAKETLLTHSFGWGIDGMDQATAAMYKKYSRMGYGEFLSSGNMRMDEYNKKGCIGEPACINNKNGNNTTFWWTLHLNTKDGLSNFFKMFTEFGIFTFIIFFYFTKYLLNMKSISSYNLFIITLFIAMNIRGIGYFNGGFIFCLLEFFFYKKFIPELEFNKKN